LEGLGIISWMEIQPCARLERIRDAIHVPKGALKIGHW